MQRFFLCVKGAPVHGKLKWRDDSLNFIICPNLCAFTNDKKSTNNNIVIAQNKEDFLPVATLSIALHVLRRFMSASNVAPEVTFCHRLYKHQ